MQIRNQKDFWSGMMFVLFGLLFMVWSTDYQFGTSQRMGPGYFPTMLGIGQIILGLMVAIPALGKRAEASTVEAIGWRGLFIVLGAVGLYAALLPVLGFVASLIVLVILSAMASPEFNLKETLLSTAVLGVGSYLAFVKGLSLQFAVWPPFLYH